MQPLQEARPFRMVENCKQSVRMRSIDRVGPAAGSIAAKTKHIVSRQLHGSDHAQVDNLPKSYVVGR